MTSLAKQLQKLAIPGQPSLRQVVSKKRPSLLFDAKEAADIDVATIHALGCNGLEALISIDAAFAEFETTLFHSSCQTFERTVQTKEILQELDETLSLFLRKLSPYFLLKPAQKCLEWLIRAFRINSFNVDSVMECVLPYYETKLFARVLQLLPLKDHTNVWHWLRPSQKAGSPLSRLTLVQHCIHNPSFLSHLCEMVPRSISANGSSPSSALRGTLALYLSTVVGVLREVKISEELLTLLLPHVLKGLKSVIVDYRAATYVIVGQLVAVATLEGRLNSSLLEAISKHITSHSSLEALSCMAVICQTQRIAVLSRKTVKYLLKWPLLVSDLADLTLSHGLAPLLRALLATLVAREIHGNTTPLLQILDEIKLDEQTALHLVKELFSQFVAACEEGEGEKAVMSVAGIVQALDAKYPTAMDRALQVICSGGDHQQWLDRLVSHSLPSSRHQLLQQGTTLALSMHHGNPAIRRAAVRQLGRALTEKGSEGVDVEFASSSLLARLADEDPSVVAAVLDIEPQVLFASADPGELTRTLLKLLAKRHLYRSTSPWQSCALQAVETLSSQSFLDHAPQLANDVIITAVPLLFMCRYGNQFAGRVADILAGSAMATTHPLLSGLSDILSLPAWRCVSAEESCGDVRYLSLASEVVLTHFGQRLGTLSHDSALAMFKLLTAALKEATDKHVQFSLATVAGVAIETAPLPLQLEFVHTIFGHILSPPDHLTSPSLEVSGCPDRVADVFKLVVQKHPKRILSHALLLLWLLKTIVVNLQVPAELSTSMWLGVPQDRTTEEKYYCALLKLLSLLTCCIDTADTDTGIPAACKGLLQNLFQAHLKSRGVLLRFLAMVWTAPSNDDITPALQARCLSIAAAYISSLSCPAALMLTTPHCPVIPSLLVPLMSVHEAVRQSALKCLTALHTNTSASETTPTSHAPLLQLVATLCDSRLELLADATTLQQLLGKMMSVTPLRRKRKRAGSGAWPDPQAVLDCLVMHVVATDMPCHIQCSLLTALTGVEHLSKLNAVVPAIHSLLGSWPTSRETAGYEARVLQLMIGCYGDNMAQFLQTETEGFQLLLKLLGATHSSLTTPTPQEMAVEQITAEFFVGLPPTAQRLLLCQLIDSAVDASSSVTLLKACIQKLPLTAELIATELSRHDNKVGVSSATPSKRLRRSKVATALTGWNEEESMPLPWKRVMLTLELSQQSVEALADAHFLVPVLFNLLDRCLELDAECRQQLEYTQQLILSHLLILTPSLSPGDGGPVAEGGFNVELIVQCIRVSSNPQTHHHALLLLSAAAGVYPARVLHNIMPVFTFMGAHIMRHDDQYSFQVIAKTIDSVIPALVKSDAAMLSVAGSLSRGKRSVSKSSSVVTVVTEIIRVFVDAGPHVPEHRRLPLFSRLLATVGVGQYLHVAMAMIIEQQVTERSVKDENSQNISCLGSSFLVALFHSFPVLTQLEAILHTVQFISLLPLEKPDTATKLRQIPAEVSSLFSVAAHSDRQLRGFKLTTFSLLASLLTHHTFTTEAQEVGGANLITLETTILSILQHLLGYGAALRRKENVVSVKFLEGLTRKVYTTMSQVVALMSPASFVEVVMQLIGQSSHVTGHVTGEAQRKAIEMLSAKLADTKSSFTEENDPALLQMLEVLMGVAKDSPAHPSTRQSALRAVELMAKHFRARRETHFVQVLEEVVSMATEVGLSPLILSSCLLCVAELCSVLGPHSIPLLPSLLPLTLSHITNNSPDQLLLAATTTLSVVVETLPKLLSGYIVNIIAHACGPSLVGVAEGLPLCKQATQLRERIATGIPARVLLPAFVNSYPLVEQHGKSSLLALLVMLEAAVTGLSVGEVKVHSHSLLELFTALLDYRVTHAHEPVQDVRAVEEMSVQVFCSLVVKLSEAAFRPMFLMLLDWATSSSAPRARTIAFYHLADRVAGKLKALFLLFAGHIVKSATKLLDKNHTDKYESPFFEDESQACELLEHVLQCLRQCFLHDHRSFLTRERFHTILQPLMDQVSNQCGGEEQFSERIEKHVAPCVAAFALAAGKEAHWKALNQQLLLKTRHSSPQVRLASVQVLQEVCAKLGEEFVVLLPETLPFLAELMEDESEEVEHATHELIRSLEQTLGEDIQQYF